MEDPWDDITDSELLAACNTSEFITGRAVLCVNDEEIFVKPYDIYLSDIQKTVSKANEIGAVPGILFDKHYLFLLTLAPSNEIPIVEEWSKRWSGCIILELILDEYFGMTNTQYIGVLFFSKNTLRRDLILQQSYFDKQDLLSENCVIEWFSDSLKYQLLASEEHRCRREPCYFILWSEAITLIANGELTKQPGSIYNCLTSKWQVFTCVDKWINNTKCSEIFNFLPSMKTVNFLEYVFLFLHISLRVYRKYIPPLHIFVKIMQQIQTITSNSLDIESISEKTIQQLSEIGCNQYVVMNLLSQFTSYFQMLTDSVTLYADVLKHTDKKRQQLYAFEIFTNYKLDNITAKSINTAPASYFNHEAIQEWVDTIHSYVDSELSMPDLFTSIKDGLKHTRKHGLFYLYGTFDNIVSILNNNPNFKCQYEIKTGSLSQSTNKTESQQSTPFWNSNKIILPWNNSKNNVSTTQKRCLLSFNLRSPIWCQWKDSFHNYFWVERINSKGLTIDEVLHTIYSQSDSSYNHEVINPYLSISNVLLDIDIKNDTLNPTLLKSIQMNKTLFIEDLISLIQHVFQKLSIPSSDLNLYVFENNRINPSKQSFHVHVGLPHDVVIEGQNECVEIINILNTLRHFYPDTLGLPYYDIFDDAIYNKKGGIHCLRGPYQLKHDGTTKLECIYRNDQKPLHEHIPLHHQFIHGGQYNHYEGTVIYEIKNTFLISDNFFLDQTQSAKLDETTQKICLSNIFELMEEINKYVILFHSDDISKNLSLLEEIINSTWKQSKLKISYWMRNEDYSSEHIQYILHKCHFKVDRNTNNIRLVNSATYSPNIPVCLRYNHHSHTDSTWYQITFRNGMKCFLLLSKCFKGRCEDKRVLSHRLDIIPIYFAPCIKDYFKNFLHSLDITRYICIEIIKVGEEVKQIKYCPNNRDVLRYMLANNVNGIARLFLLIEDKYLCCRLVNNCCVLIIKASDLVIYYSDNDSTFHEFLQMSQILDTHLQNRLVTLLEIK